jgi:hypothetical protein
MAGRSRWKVSLLTALVLLAPAGCSASEEPSTAASSPLAVASPAHFSSRTFSLPFTVALPVSLKSEPREDIKTLISWKRGHRPGRRAVAAPERGLPPRAAQLHRPYPRTTRHISAAW